MPQLETAESCSGSAILVRCNRRWRDRGVTVGDYRVEPSMFARGLASLPVGLGLGGVVRGD